jgi:alpha-glucoside transport system substrate-binding protein
MPFDSPPVRQAFERLGRILFTDGYLAEAPTEVEFGEAQLPMVAEDSPGCWLYQFPTFAAGALPRGSVGESTDFFPFPSVGPSRQAVVGAGEMFSDRPEVRALVRYLLSPAYGATLPDESIHFISANQRFDLATYDPFTRHEAEVINAALANDAFRFDASDLMPLEVGGELFWDAMMRYAEEGPESLDAILAELDGAWPDDTS